MDAPSPPAADLRRARLSVPPEWRWPLAAIAAGIATLLALHWLAVTGAVRVWIASSTYRSLFFVLPAVFYLIWERRGAAAATAPRPGWTGAAVAFGFGLVALVSDAADVMIGRQVALVGSIQALLLSVLGWRAYRALLLPLAMLWLLIPAGDFLLPTLQAMTTAATVAGVQLLGIPASADGHLIRVPSGLYRVVEQCSALDFLIGALLMSLFYAALIYESPRKRAFYIGAALALAIVANWFRTATVVAITHYSDRAIDLAADHSAYGWSVFLAATAGLMWAGYRYRDARPAPRPAPAAGVRPALYRTLWVTSAVLVAAAAGPVYGALSRQPAGAPAGAELCLPERMGPWRAHAAADDWLPTFPGAQTTGRARYRAEGAPVDLFIAYRASRRRGVELIGSGNEIARADRWLRFPATGARARLGDRNIAVIETVLRKTRTKRVVWHWYWIGGTPTASRRGVKLRQARAVLLGGDTRAAVVAVSSQTTGDAREARAALRRFLAQGGGVAAALTRAGRTGACPK